MNKNKRQKLNQKVAHLQWQMQDAKLVINSLCSPADTLVLQKVCEEKQRFCSHTKLCLHNNCQFFNYLSYSFNIMQKINYLYELNIISISRENIIFYFKKINKEIDRFVEHITYYIGQINELLFKVKSKKQSEPLWRNLLQQLILLHSKILAMKISED